MRGFSVRLWASEVTEVLLDHGHETWVDTVGYRLDPTLPVHPIPPVNPTPPVHPILPVHPMLTGDEARVAAELFPPIREPLFLPSPSPSPTPPPQRIKSDPEFMLATSDSLFVESEEVGVRPKSINNAKGGRTLESRIASIQRALPAFKSISASANAVRKVARSQSKQIGAKQAGNRPHAVNSRSALKARIARVQRELDTYKRIAKSAKAIREGARSWQRESEAKLQNLLLMLEESGRSA